MRKNCSSDREKQLKFEAEGRKFANFLRSLEQFIQTVKGQNNFLVSRGMGGQKKDPDFRFWLVSCTT